MPNGSAAAPAIHFGDSDSGLYGDSSNGVRITAGGSDRIVATANGVTFPPQAAIKLIIKDWSIKLML